MKAEDIVQMAKDAARYRFMRDVVWAAEGGWHVALPEQADAEIDRMMAELDKNK